MILSDTVVPLALDAVVEFGDLEPNKIDIMIERGLVPAWSADAAKLYPDLWPTSQAARKAYSRDGLDVERNRRRSVTGPYKYRYIRESHTPLVRYQPKGPGQKSRIALIDDANLADARARIEAALGELTSFEVVAGEQQSEPSQPVLVWGKPGSNLAARLAAPPESPSSRSGRRAERLRWPLWWGARLEGCFMTVEPSIEVFRAGPNARRASLPTAEVQWPADQGAICPRIAEESWMRYGGPQNPQVES
jgi:hypothetical protein